MAFNISGQNNATQTTYTAGGATVASTADSGGNNATTQQTQQTQAYQTRPDFGVRSLMSDAGSGGETYEKIYTKFQEAIKDRLSDTVEKFTVHKLLKTTAGLNYSCIVLAEAKDDVVFAHVLMIEKTGNFPDKVIETYNGTRYEVIRTPGDALDNKVRDTAIELLSRTLRVNADNVYVGDGTLVPNEFNPNSEASMGELINNAINATHVELNINCNDYKGIKIQEYIGGHPRGKFAVSLSFNNDDTDFSDQTDMPVRQDICVTLTYKMSQPGVGRSIHPTEDSKEIVRVYGYIDFDYTGPVVINGAMTSQKFAPNFIITHMHSGYGLTPDIIMLGVASVSSLSENMNWAQGFRPSVSRKGEIDYNDIGALNVQGNIMNDPTGFGKRYDTKDPKVSSSTITRMIQILCAPTLQISVDVPNAGPETWYMSVFSKQAELEGQGKSTKRIKDFMFTATDGLFDLGASQLFLSTANYIQGGYYRTGKDSVRDVRHLLSYLSVVNHVIETNQSPNVIVQYLGTLYNTSIPASLRATVRNEYLKSMASSPVVFKQMFTRLTFNGKTLSTWVDKLIKSGFRPEFTGNPTDGGDMFTQRFVANTTDSLLPQDLRVMRQVNQDYNPWNTNTRWTRNYN